VIKCNDWPTGVCTWSIGNDFDKLGALREQSELSHIHFAVSPILNKNGEGAIDITAELGVKYLSFHFGFLELTDKLTDRAKILADKAAQKNIQLLMETGQETASELHQFLEEVNHPALGVNFDPANMILYDKGNPIESVQTLAGWIKHVHIKDALRPQTPGTWGVEVPWGAGQAGGSEFLKALKQINFVGALAIEREAGDDRLGDIKTAAEALNGFAG